MTDDAKVFQDVCLLYIEQAATLRELEALKPEIASLIKEMGISEDEVTLTRAAFLRKRRQLTG